MKLSLAYEMQRPVLDDHAVIEETIEQCVLADKMGFDYVWFVEHHFLTGFSMSPCPEVIFGALSKLTKRIRLGVRGNHPTVSSSRTSCRTGGDGRSTLEGACGFRNRPLCSV